MSTTIQEYQRLKEAAETKRRKADRARGELDAARKRLQAEFNCPTLEHGRQKLAELQEREQRLSAKFKSRLSAFKERWLNVLE